MKECLVLRQFREFGQTTVVKYGLIVLAVSFITWGIGDYLNGSNNPAAAEVNGDSISLNEIFTAYEQRKNQFGQLTGSPISDETAAQMGLPNLVVGEIIRDKLLHQASVKAGFVASERVIAEAIASMQAFQEDGEFSKDIYLNQLRTLGLNSSAFEGDIKREQEQNMLSALFRAPVNAEWAKNIATLKNSLFDLTVIPVSARHLEKLKAPTDKELNEFYTARSAQYATPETRDISVLTLSTAELLKNIDISDADIKSYYDENPNEFLTAEQRKVMQIILPTKEAATAQRAELMAGAAPQNPIDLGWAMSLDLPDTISSAVFSQPVDTYSVPIETPFGFAIVWSTDIKEAAQKPLVEVSTNIKESLAYTRAEDMFEDTLNDIQDAAAAGDNMASIAAQFKLPLKIHTAIQPNSELDNTVKQTAVELRIGEISDAIELSDDAGVTMAFVKVTGITESTLPPLSQQRAKVMADFNQVRDETRVSIALQGLQKRLNDGEQLANALGSEKISVRPVELTKKSRADLEKLNWRAQQIDGLLSLSSGQVLATPLPYNNAQALIVLEQRITKAPTQIEVELARESLATDINGELFRQYLSHLQNTSDIEIYESRLQTVFNQNAQ